MLPIEVKNMQEIRDYIKNDLNVILMMVKEDSSKETLINLIQICIRDANRLSLIED